MAEGSDQGAAVTVNGNRSWSSWYNQPTGQFYHVAADNRFPYWVYSGQQDSGTVAIASRSDYGAPNLRDWHPVGGDERDYDIPDPADSNIVYGSGLSDGNHHLHDDLPTLLIGRGGNYFKPGRRITFRKETPMANLQLTLMDRMGVRVDHFGDASGRIAPASLT